MPFKHKWSRTNVLPSKEWNLLIDYAEACIEEEKKNGADTISGAPSWASVYFS